MASLLSLVSSMIQPKDIEFVKLLHTDFGNLNNGIIPLTLAIKLKNPNNISATLQSYNLNLYSGETHLGVTSQSAQEVIPANDAFEIVLAVNLISGNIKGVLHEFLEILTEGKVKVPVRIAGELNIKKFGFNFDLPINFTREFEFKLDDLLQKIKL